VDVAQVIPLTRARQNALACTAVAGPLLLAACGGSEQALTDQDPFCGPALQAVERFMSSQRTSAEVREDPRYGGTVVVGGIADAVGGMNSAAASDFIAAQHQQFVSLMTLVDYDPDGNPRPYLAESWDVAPDFSSVTFQLRPDVFWHDGEPTDAEDVAFTFRTVTNPATGFPNASYWDGYVAGDEGVEVLDTHTVRFRMRPHAQFLDPFRSLGILPEHLLGDVPAEEIGEHPFGTRCPVGNGPFVFVSHAPLDRWVFEANPAFPAGLGGRPFVDRYVYRIIPEQTTLLAELIRGDIDVYLQPPPGQAERIREADGANLRAYPSRSVVFVAWNSRRETLADRRVRSALTMATDRIAIVEGLLDGFGSVAHTGVPPFHFGYSDEIPGPLHDPAAARRLLTTPGGRTATATASASGRTEPRSRFR
jgi:peptide/nickel transport system substrate-binding protein